MPRRTHRTYFGPELGLDLHLGPVLLRPWVGAGLLVAINRTAVRQFARNDDALRFYLAPGLLGGLELGRWLVGLDARVPILPAEPSSQWAPSLFLVIATSP